MGMEFKEGSAGDEAGVLVHLGCYNKNTLEWVAYKQ